jgi:hypothetical protein
MLIEIFGFLLRIAFRACVLFRFPRKITKK